MGLAETAQLIAEITLKDGASKPAQAVSQEMQALENQAQATAKAVATSGEAGRGFGERLEAARPKIREFARAGSELSVVAAVLGNDLGTTLGPLGEFIHILGDAGLIATAFGDLAPAFARTATGALGLGAAAATASGGLIAEGVAAEGATVALDGLAASEVAATAGAAGLGAALLVVAPFAIAGGVALAGLTLLNQKLHDDALDAALAEREHARALGITGTAAEQQTAAVRELTREWVTGKITGAQYEAGIAAIHTRFLQANGVVKDAAIAVAILTAAAQGFVNSGGDVVAIIDALTHRSQDLNDVWTGTTLLGGVLKDSFEGADAAARSATDSFNVETTAVANLTGAALSLGSALDLLPTTVDISVVTTFTSNAQGVGAQPPEPGTGVEGVNADSFQIAERQRQIREENARAAAAAAARAQSAADAAAAKAKQRAQELARAYRNDVDDAFKTAKRTSETLFDSLHNRNLQAVKDAETLAQKNHDAAIQSISDNLKAREAENAAPVTAAEKALKDRETAQQRRGLVEAQIAARAAVQNVQQGSGQSQEDFNAQVLQLGRALRDANEALENFDASQNVDRLKATQTRQDTAAQQAAKDQTAREDATLAKAQRQALLDTAGENKRNTEQVAKFERALSALRVADLAAHKPTSAIDTDITALEKRFGVFTDAQGFHHIQDPVVAAIKDIKITPAPVNLSFNPTLTFRIGARELAAAIVSQTNPSQAGTVRTGQTQR